MDNMDNMDNRSCIGLIDLLGTDIDVINNFATDFYSSIDGSDHVFSPLAIIQVIGLIQLAMIDPILVTTNFDGSVLRSIHRCIKTTTVFESYLEINAKYLNIIGNMITTRRISKKTDNLTIHNNMNWSIKLNTVFRSKYTQKLLFHETSTISMMRTTTKAMYLETANVHAVELFLDDQNFHFGVILPRKYITEDNLYYNVNNVPIFNTNQILEYANNMVLTDIDITIPRIQHTSHIDVKPILKKMSYGGFFNKPLDLISYGIVLKNIFHTCTINLIEDDHKLEEPVKINPTTKIVFDHIFVYYIRYVPDNIILVYGDYQGD